MKGIYKNDNKNKEVRTTVALGYDIYQKLKDISFKNDMTMSNVIELLVNGRPSTGAGYLFLIDKEVLLKVIIEAECKDIDMIELYINNIVRKRYDIKDREKLREKKRTMRAKKKQPKKVAKKKK